MFSFMLKGWLGKTPCWEMFRCPEMIMRECPTPKYTSLPCWQIEGTYCKLDEYGTNGLDTSICELCRVYKQYGDKRPLQIKLFGKGINASLRTLTAPVQKEDTKVELGASV